MDTKKTNPQAQNTQKKSKIVEECLNSADSLVKQPKSRQQIADEALNNATTKG